MDTYDDLFSELTWWQMVLLVLVWVFAALPWIMLIEIVLWLGILYDRLREKLHHYDRLQEKLHRA